MTPEEIAINEKYNIDNKVEQFIKRIDKKAGMRKYNDEFFGREDSDGDIEVTTLIHSSYLGYSSDGEPLYCDQCDEGRAVYDEDLELDRYCTNPKCENFTELETE